MIDYNKVLLGLLVWVILAWAVFITISAARSMFMDRPMGGFTASFCMGITTALLFNLMTIIYKVHAAFEEQVAIERLALEAFTSLKNHNSKTFRCPTPLTQEGE